METGSLPAAPSRSRDCIVFRKYMQAKWDYEVLFQFMIVAMVIWDNNELHM